MEQSSAAPAAAIAPAAAGAEPGRLHRRALGVPDIVFFIVAASAPLTVVGGGVASTYLVTGNRGVPLIFIVLGAILALFVSGYAAMSHHITNAGAFYSYVANGLGKVPGVGAALVALVAYNSMQIGIFGLFGAAFGAFIADKVGLDIAWWGWCFIAMGVIGVLGWLRVDLNAKVLAVFLTLEVLVLVVFDLTTAADPGPEGFLWHGFDPSLTFGAAVGSAFVFTMAAFTGFESAAIYGEEVRDPRRTVARATYIALGVTSLFYAICALCLGNAAGPSVITNPDALVKAGFTGAGGAPDPTTVIFVFLNSRIGVVVSDVANLLFCTSLFAALLSFHNAVARYGFALGREGVLPSAFGRTTKRTGAPFVGSSAQTVLAVIVVAVFALTGSDPVLKLFTWLTNLGALGVMLLLSATSFSVIGFFWRDRRGERAWTVRTAPALAGVLLAAVFVLAITNFNVLITGLQHAPLSSLSIILPAILIAGAVLGLILGAYLKANRPAVYARIGRGAEGA